jgi:hypothetical protein
MIPPSAINHRQNHLDVIYPRPLALLHTFTTYFFKINFNKILPPFPLSAKLFLSLGFVPNQNCTSSFCYTFYMFHPAQSYGLINAITGLIKWRVKREESFRNAIWILDFRSTKKHRDIATHETMSLSSALSKDILDTEPTCVWHKVCRMSQP